jgi:cytochrome c oxidase assembly factor CtaG
MHAPVAAVTGGFGAAMMLPWAWEPGVVIPLAISAAAYAVGSRRPAAATERPTGHWTIPCFWLGWVTLVIALVSPLDTLSDQLFWMHMVQHELLMTVAAPLLVLGRPLAIGVRALPASRATELRRAWRSRPAQRVWEVITRPFDAWLLHGAVIWLWHAPVLFDAALASDFVHAMQHLAFLLTAMLFWESLFYAQRHAAAAGLAVVYLFTTAVHTGALGALMTFARSPWYVAYAQRALAWGFTPMQDQQLAGLIMWIPGSVVYLIAALVLAARWLRTSDAVTEPVAMPAAVQP